MSKPLLKFPFEIVPLEKEINFELLQYFQGERDGFVQVGPERYFFPQKYVEEAEAYYNFQARPNDVWVASFPRSGTTWTQELVWLVANNLDFERACQSVLTERFPFFEFSIFMHPYIKAELLQLNCNEPAKCNFIEQISHPGYKLFDEIPTTRRRFIKTHFPFSLLPPSVMEQKCKIIYVARNVKDVAISFYHLNRLYKTQGYTGDFARYWQYFEQGFNPWLPYYSHLKEALAQRGRSNVLFLRYEDMCKDLRGTIGKVSKFLDVQLSAKGVESLINHLNISNFRLNLAVNGQEMANVGVLNGGEQGFVRNGTVEIMQKEFAANAQLLERANNWITTNENNLNLH